PVPEERHVRQADGAVLSFRKRREADGAAIGGEVAGERDVEEGRVTGLDVDGGAGAAEVVLEPEVDEGEGAAAGDPHRPPSRGAGEGEPVEAGGAPHAVGWHEGSREAQPSRDGGPVAAGGP